MHLADLAQFRQAAYRLISSMLIYPEEERLRTVAAAAAGLLPESSVLAEFLFYPQWQRLLACLAEVAGRRSLGEDYVRLFWHGSGAAPCLPYESVYADPNRQAAPWIMAMLEDEYGQAGLTLSASVEPPDHIAVEMEFMAYLCCQEVEAWREGNLAQGLVAMGRQLAFLDRHLIRWVPGWAVKVMEADTSGVYLVVAEAARVFVLHDCDLIDVLLRRFKGLAKADHGETDFSTAVRVSGTSDQELGGGQNAPS
ncbi:MAG: hypothetical protein D9V47_02795 [Clostridia bacterium]|nr:MAG: hypothetical protein D9V47_02795 [Clostridia bacterium]